MSMSAAALKTALKAGLLEVFDACDDGPGISKEEYADMIAGVIATKVVEHITGYAAVTTMVTGTAGPYPVTGSGTGQVS